MPAAAPPQRPVAVGKQGDRRNKREEEAHDAGVVVEHAVLCGELPARCRGDHRRDRRQPPRERRGGVVLRDLPEAPQLPQAHRDRQGSANPPADQLEDVVAGQRRPRRATCQKPHRVHAPRRHVLVPRRLVANTHREHRQQHGRYQCKRDLAEAEPVQPGQCRGDRRPHQGPGPRGAILRQLHAPTLSPPGLFGQLRNAAEQQRTARFLPRIA